MKITQTVAVFIMRILIKTVLILVLIITTMIVKSDELMIMIKRRRKSRAPDAASSSSSEHLLLFYLPRLSSVGAWWQVRGKGTGGRGGGQEVFVVGGRARAGH